MYVAVSLKTSKLQIFLMALVILGHSKDLVQKSLHLFIHATLWAVKHKHSSLFNKPSINHSVI